MYKVAFTKAYTQMVFIFKDYDNACDFLKVALWAGEADVKVSITFEAEEKEGEE